MQNAVLCESSSSPPDPVATYSERISQVTRLSNQVLRPAGIPDEKDHLTSNKKAVECEASSLALAYQGGLDST